MIAEKYFELDTWLRSVILKYKDTNYSTSIASKKFEAGNLIIKIDIRTKDGL